MSRKFFRCDLCDYNNLTGSGLTDTAPNKAIKVKYYPEYDRNLCSDCISSIYEQKVDFECEQVDED